jgi:hypothetical protein
MSLVSEINEYRLDPELLGDAIVAHAEAHPNTAGTAEGFAEAIAVAVHASGLSIDEAAHAARAIHFRLSALAQLLRDGGGRGFSVMVEPGRRRISEELVRCAAEEPLLDRDGPVSFDPDSFHRRLLSIAQPAGKA